MTVSKLLRSPQLCNQWRLISTLATAPFLHTAKTTPHKNLKTDLNNRNTSLYRWISPLGDPTVSISHTLDQWLQEQHQRGVHVDQVDVRKVLVQLRKFRRFKHALQLSEWMGKNNQFEMTSGDVAIRLDLISKVHGIRQAEEYFNNILEKLRDFKVYGALLSCYAHEKSLEKAEATMQKMKELGFTRLRLSYNVLMGLYLQLGKRKKLDNLVQEMEEKGIGFDKFTYCIMLNAYATSSNLAAMENLLMKMEADPHIVMDRDAYSVATNGYIRAGKMDKALVMLRKVEQLSRFKATKVAYEILLTLYARIGHRDEVYRVWDVLKGNEKTFNTTYLAMMSSLSILDDLDGMEKIFKDWEANNKYFDSRIPNFLVMTYCRKGLLDKAELLVNRLMESSNKQYAGTWDRLAAGYHRFGHMEKAVDAMKKALLVSTPGYKPNFSTLMGCIDYLEGKDDDEAAEFRTLFEEYGHSISDIHARFASQTSSGAPGSSAEDSDWALEDDEMDRSDGFENKHAS